MGEELLGELGVLTEAARKEAATWAATEPDVSNVVLKDITTMQRALGTDGSPVPDKETYPDFADGGEKYADDLYGEDPEEETTPPIPDKKTGKNKITTLAKVVGAAVLVFGTQALVFKIIDGVTTNEVVTEEAPTKADTPDIDRLSVDWPEDNPEDLVPVTTGVPVTAASPEVLASPTTVAPTPAVKRVPAKGATTTTKVTSASPASTSTSSTSTSPVSSTSLPPNTATTSSSPVTTPVVAPPITPNTTRPLTNGEKAQIAADSYARRLEAREILSNIVVKACSSEKWRSRHSTTRELQEPVLGSPISMWVNNEMFLVAFIKEFSTTGQAYTGKIKALVAGSGAQYEVIEAVPYNPETGPPPYGFDQYSCNSPNFLNLHLEQPGGFFPAYTVSGTRPSTGIQRAAVANAGQYFVD